MNFFLPAHAIAEGGSLDIMFKGFVCLSKKDAKRPEEQGAKGARKSKF